MSYFLSPTTLVSGQVVTIDGPEAAHMLHSRRFKVGEGVVLQDPVLRRCKAEITDIGRNILKLKVLQEVPVPAELPVSISLFQAVVSEKALDFIFQKSTELGAAEIVLFNSQNVAAKLTADKFKSKHERWNKILWESAKQCDRAKIPQLKFLPDLESVISEAGKFDQFLILDASGANLQPPIKNFKSLAFLVGPEGGLTRQELSKFQSISQYQLISISAFTLRAETAAIAGLSIVQNLLV